VKSLNCSVTVLRAAGDFGGTYGFLVGSEMTRLGGGAFRPSTTADEGTALSPNSVGVTAPLPITKVSRKQRDAMTVGIFIEGGFRRFALQLGKRRSLRKGIALTGNTWGNAISPLAGERAELRTAPAYAQRT
jgi:hypothetical protein